VSTHSLIYPPCLLLGPADLCHSTRGSGLLDEFLPDLGPLQRNRVMDAAAVAAYHAQLEFLVVRLVICIVAPSVDWLLDYCQTVNVLVLLVPHHT
jgi:hypothetical protein